MHARLRGQKKLINSLPNYIKKTDFPSLADELAEPRPDMNIKVAAFTVSEKSSNIWIYVFSNLYRFMVYLLKHSYVIGFFCQNRCFNQIYFIKWFAIISGFCVLVFVFSVLLWIVLVFLTSYFLFLYVNRRGRFSNNCLPIGNTCSPPPPSHDFYLEQSDQR